MGALFLVATAASVIGTALPRPFVDDPNYLSEMAATRTW
jgi:hypothetical protein